MKRIMSSCVLLICIFPGISAHAADEQKRRQLVECNFETEKVIVLYKAIYEGGRLGQHQEDAYALYQKQLDAAQSAEQRKRAEENLKNERDKESYREEKVREGLLDKCMQISGLSFNPFGEDCIVRDGKATRPDYNVDCWIR